MSFCRLCGEKEQKLVSDGSEHTIGSPSTGQMLEMFQNLNASLLMTRSTVTCLSCLTSLKFCYTFYRRVIRASRSLSEKLNPKENSTIFRRIAPKQQNDIVATTSESCRKKKRRYTCEECPSEFTSYRKLLVHHKQHEITNVCQYCGTFYSNENALNAHITDNHSDLKYECLKCRNSFTSRSSLWKHFKKDHQTSYREYRCSSYMHQSDVFLGRACLEKHVEHFHPELAQKTREEEGNQRDDDVEPDMIEEFLDDMDEEFLDDFLMNGDQNSFCWDDLSLTHFDEHFNSPVPETESLKCNRFECPQCDQRFSEPQFLNRHLAYDHDEFVLVCNTCGMKFNRHDLLKTHLNLHLTDKLTSNSHKGPPFQCSSCEKSYKTLGGLKYHLNTHTGAKPYACPYCEKLFTASINLNAHIRYIHTEIKPNMCTLCDRKFATLDHLKKHVMSVHQKEKNHLCSTCGKAFSQASHLRQHVIIHSGQKPFKCTYCSTDFFKRSDLRRHIEVSHDNADVTAER